MCGVRVSRTRMAPNTRMLSIWGRVVRLERCPPTERMTTMPKYLMLIMEAEAAYENATEADFSDVMQQHTSFAREVEEAGGKILGGEALQPISTASYLRGTRRDVVTVRQPGARPQGGPRRLLPRRGHRRGPRPQDRRALPGAAGLRRGAPDLGVRRHGWRLRPLRRRPSPPTPSGATGAACCPPRCAWRATSTSPRRRPRTPSPWPCRPGRTGGCRTRSRPGCSPSPGAGPSTGSAAWPGSVSASPPSPPRATWRPSRPMPRSTLRPCSTTSCASSCCAATRPSPTKSRSP